MDRLFARVVRLRQAVQEHCHGGKVLAVPSELWGIGSPIRGVALDLPDATLGAVHRSMRTGHSVVRRVRWRSWWLMRPLSS